MSEGRNLFNAEPIPEIGNFYPAEIMQQKFVGQISVSKFYIRLKDLETLRLIGQFGQVETDTKKDILKWGILDIVVYDVGQNEDSIENKVAIRTYQGCVCHEYMESFRTNAIAGENAIWLYRNYK